MASKITVAGSGTVAALPPPIAASKAGSFKPPEPLARLLKPAVAAALDPSPLNVPANANPSEFVVSHETGRNARRGIARRVRRGDRQGGGIPFGAADNQAGLAEMVGDEARAGVELRVSGAIDAADLLMRAGDQ